MYKLKNIIVLSLIILLFGPISCGKAKKNKEPVANAGEDITVTVGTTVQIDGSDSTDSNGDELSYLWKVLSKPKNSQSDLVPDEIISSVTNLYIDIAGTYEVELVVNDGKLDSEPEVVIISTVNSLPVADSGIDTIAQAGTKITLDGSQSIDTDGNRLSYQWALISKPDSSEATIENAGRVFSQLNVDKPGVYINQLIVKDGEGEGEPDNVVVSTGNIAPTVLLRNNYTVEQDSVVFFDAAGSFDMNGDLLSYEWSILSKPGSSQAGIGEKSSAKPWLNIDRPGSYIVQLKVSDGEKDSADTLVLSTQNSEPVADAGTNQLITEGQGIELNGNKSFDPDQSPLSYRWAILAAPEGSSAILTGETTHSPFLQTDQSGDYVVQLIVNDGLFDSEPDTVVVSTGNLRPIANAGSDRSVETGATVELSAANSFDPNGGELQYQWSLIHRPKDSKEQLSSANTKTTTFMKDVAGIYVVQLVVSDGEMWSRPDTVVISVPNNKPVANIKALPEIYIGDTVNLDGGASSDADGDSLIYLWNIIDKPSDSQASIDDSQSATTHFIADVKGDYTVELVVNDGQLDSDPVKVIASVQSEPKPNTKPSAELKGGSRAFTGIAHLLDGRGSRDMDQDPLEFHWKVVRKPNGSNPVIIGVSDKEAELLTDRIGSYQVSLIVSDGKANSEPVYLDVQSNSGTPSVAPDLQRIIRSLPQNGLITITASAGSVEDSAEIQVMNISTGASQSLIVGSDGDFEVKIAGSAEDILDVLILGAEDKLSPAARLLPIPPPRLSMTQLVDQTATLGQTLRFKLDASDLDQEDIAFEVSPLPLPRGALFNLKTGDFSFKPKPDVVGEWELTFSAKTLDETVSETIRISVPPVDTNAPTRLSGYVIDADSMAQGQHVPIVGAKVSFVGTGISSTTDENGRFTLTGMEGTDLLFDIDTTNANPSPDDGPYALFREALKVIPHAHNIEERPFSMPRIAVNSLTPVVSGLATSVNNPDLEITLDAAANTVVNPDGTPFEGSLSISLVPNGLAPAAMPENLNPGTLITIQPGGVRFNTPAPIRFPNTDNLTPGTEVDIMSIDPEVGRFEAVAVAVVSTDGKWIDTVEGGIRAADWHFPMPSTAETEGNDDEDNPGGCPAESGSTTCVGDGRMTTEFSLPVYQTLIHSRSVEFVYQTHRAFVAPVIKAKFAIGESTSIPEYISASVRASGVSESAEIFYDMSELLDKDRNKLIAVNVPLLKTNYETGFHIYSGLITSHYSDSSFSAPIGGRIIVVNEEDSPYGAGWMMKGVPSLKFVNIGPNANQFADNKGILLIDPMGMNQFFTWQGEQECISPSVNGLCSAFQDEFGNARYSASKYSIFEMTGAASPDLAVNTFTLRNQQTGDSWSFNDEGQLIAKRDRNDNTTDYYYDLQGRLVAIEDPMGQMTLLEYSGGRIASVQDPASRVTYFEHDSAGNLTKVTLPDGNERFYSYDERHLMTSRLDGNSNETVYEYDAYGKNTKVVLADGSTREFASMQDYGLIPANTKENAIKFQFKEDVASSLVDANGNASTRKLGTNSQPLELIDAEGKVFSIERDGFGNPITKTYPNGLVVQEKFNVNHQVIEQTNNEDGGVWKYEYDDNGQITTITDPLDRVTNYSRDESGNLIEFTNAVGHIVSIENDEYGNPIRIINPNGLVKEITYNSAGMVRELTEYDQDSVTDTRSYSFEYDNAGNTTKVISPEGREYSLVYDGRGRLVRLSDIENESIEFEYDAYDRPISVNMNDAAGNLFVNISRGLDSRNRVNTTSSPHVGSDLSTYEYGYDNNGNRTSLKDASGNITSSVFDVLNRVVEIVDRNGGTTRFTYNDLNQLSQVVAPGGTETSYSYDKLGRLKSEQSPDRGNTTNEYGLSGELTAKTDARGVRVEYAYDDLDRRISISYPNSSENVQLEYDECENGIGRLCRRIDESGTTNYAYDVFGRLTTQEFISNGTTYSTTYSYDADDNVVSMQLPSGRQIQKQYDSSGRVSAIHAMVSGASEQIIQGTRYAHSDYVKSRTYLNGVVENRSYDKQGRVIGIQYARNGNQLENWGYEYDVNSNILRKQAIEYAYNGENELKTEDITGSPVRYSYDANGNRLQKEKSGESDDRFGYELGTNRLTTYEKLVVGNNPPEIPLSKTFTYNDANRLSELREAGLLKAEYTYNGFSQRTHKIVSGQETVFHYDTNGNLISETEADGTPVRDYVWHNNTPVAQIDTNGLVETLSLIHTDHLNTPRFATNQQGVIVWRWQSDAFGVGTPNNDVDGDGNPIVINLRFPGQYYDKEANTNYNYFRNYDVNVGRYLQSDPIGLIGGSLSTFSYASNNSLRYIDPYGLLNNDQVGNVSTGLSALALAVGGAITQHSGSLTPLGLAAAVAGSLSVGMNVGDYTNNGIELVSGVLGVADAIATAAGAQAAAASAAAAGTAGSTTLAAGLATGASVGAAILGAALGGYGASTAFFKLVSPESLTFFGDWIYDATHCE